MGTGVHIWEKGPEAMGLVDRVWALEPQSWVHILVLNPCVSCASHLVSLSPQFPVHTFE